MSSSFQIKNRQIGPSHPVYIVAEMSANHGQSLDRAIEILVAAKESGADAVKLQIYTPDSLTLDCDNPCFRIRGTLWDGRTLYDLYKEACTPREWYPKLKRVAEEIKIDLFSSAFDPSTVDFLEKMEVPVHKVASAEIVDIPLIKKMASTGKPLILSTGMATIGEIEEAVKAARDAGLNHIALLKCTSAYPAPPEEMNLRTISHLAAAFRVPAGLSDHSLGIAVPIASIAMGACIVEKHFTLSRSLPSADSAFSLIPEEFKIMAEAIRVAEKALGEIHYDVGKEETKSRPFRRSLFIVRDMRAGEIFTEENVRSIRPANGLPPKHLGEILGKRLRQDALKGTPLRWDLIA